MKFIGQTTVSSRFHSSLLPYHCEVLPNGMTLIVKEVHGAPIVALDIWTTAGSGEELLGDNGISHFYEHLFFKGTSKHPVGEFDKAIKSLGGYDNAETSFDYTHYFVVLPSEHCFTAMEILADAYLNASLPVEEINRERMVIYEEIRRKEDSPTGRLFTDFLSHLFKDTPYAMEVLGTEESLSRITRDDLLRFRECRYCPSQTTLVIAGDVNTEAVRYQVSVLFESFRKGVPAHSAVFSAQPLRQAREFSIAKQVQQSYLALGFTTEPIMGTPEDYALAVATTILGEGRSSRLYRVLQEEKRLVSDVDVFEEMFRRGGFFAVYACFDGRKAKAVKQAIWDVLNRMKDSLIQPEELEKAKTMLCTDFLFSNERVSSVANTLGDCQVNNCLEHAAQYITRIQSVTASQVQNVIRTYCRPEAQVLGLVVPGIGEVRQSWQHTR